jgi:hypothetical protein
VLLFSFDFSRSSCKIFGFVLMPLAGRRILGIAVAKYSRVGRSYAELYEVLDYACRIPNIPLCKAYVRFFLAQFPHQQPRTLISNLEAFNLGIPTPAPVEI